LFGFGHEPAGFPGGADAAARVERLLEIQTGPEGADGVGLVQAGRIEIHHGDAGLVELDAEGHHRLIGAGPVGLQADGGRVRAP
jgi:hypothetical protein